MSRLRYALVFGCGLALLATSSWAAPPHRRPKPAPRPAPAPHRVAPPPAPHGHVPAPPDWDHGYWHRGYHDGRAGWWWVVGFRWYFIDPWYPYWSPYPPERVVVVERERIEAETPGPPPPAYWYHCDDPNGYYPYVNDCRTGWTPVPAVPPGAAPKTP